MKAFFEPLKERMDRRPPRHDVQNLSVLEQYSVPLKMIDHHIIIFHLSKY
jgi:hypothetical protein